MTSDERKKKDYDEYVADCKSLGVAALDYWTCGGIHDGVNPHDPEENWYAHHRAVKAQLWAREQPPAPRSIYLLSPDGHRDSVSYKVAAYDAASIEEMIRRYIKEFFNHELVESSVNIDFENGAVGFRYNDCGSEESEVYRLFEVSLMDFPVPVHIVPIQK